MRRSPSCCPAASPIWPLASCWSPPCCPLLLLAALPHPALLTLLALLLLGAEAAVEQLLLALHQLAHAAHHLLRLARPLLRHLPGLRHAQVFEHVLQLRQQLARLVARAVARQVARAVEHALQIAAADHLRRIDRLLALVRIARHVLGERLQIAVERLLQLLHQAIDLLVRRVFCERVLQLLLQAPHLALGQRHASVLDAQRGVPQQLLDFGDRLRVVVDPQTLLRRGAAPRKTTVSSR